MRKIHISAKEGLRSVPFDVLDDEYNIVSEENDGDTSDAWPAYLKQADSWLKKYHIADFANMIYPQLLTYLSKHKLNHNEDGKIDGNQYWIDNIDPNSSWDIGLVRFIKINPRGLTVGEKQYKSPGNQYNSLVPIVLAAHKLYNDIPYNDWDRGSLRRVVNHDLADAMLYEYSSEFSKEDLIEIRNTSLHVVKTGATRSAQTTYLVCRISNPEFKLVPALAQRMLLQTWCAHPVNRTKYTVVDPDNWDNMPEPLVDAEVIISVEKSKPAKPKLVDNDYPW